MSLFGARSPDFSFGADPVIGSGAYGTAYKVTLKRDGREVVLKVVDLNKLSKIKGSDREDERKRKTMEQQEQLMIEFVRAKDISKNCPRIVRTEGAWYEEPKFYIMMEYCALTLQSQWDEVYDLLQDGEIVVNEGQNQNPFVLPGKLDVFGRSVPVDRIMSQVLEALLFLESKAVAHLDLKPDNVFIVANGDMKLGDFGLCRAVTAKKGAVSTIRGNSYGTEGFMAPEIINKLPVGTKADVYSLGVILYSCVMLRSAEKTDPLPHRINPKLWPNNGIRASLAQSMLLEDPASRPLASEIHAMLTVRRPLAPGWAAVSARVGGR
jgi:serine/threonine protein kinase